MPTATVETPNTNAAKSRAPRFGRLKRLMKLGLNTAPNTQLSLVSGWRSILPPVITGSCGLVWT